MIKPIVKDTFLLSQKSTPADQKDRQTASDLLDTLKAHNAECVGMAANMIGVNKRIIVISTGIMHVIMLNPEIIKKKAPYQTEEGCLSLKGVRPATRYKEIELEYQDLNMHKHRKTFTGFTAQIIQHECDHLEGILI